MNFHVNWFTQKRLSSSRQNNSIFPMVISGGFFWETNQMEIKIYRVIRALFHIPRKNRSKTDDVFVEKTLLDLELQYGSTEAGRLSFNLSSKISHSPTEPNLFDLPVREYIADIMKSQKGRAHPQREAMQSCQISFQARMVCRWYRFISKSTLSPENLK